AEGFLLTSSRAGNRSTTSTLALQSRGVKLMLMAASSPVPPARGKATGVEDLKVILTLLGTLRARAPSHEQLLHRAIALVDRRVGVCVCRCVRVGDGDPPERLAREHARLIFGGPLGVPQGIVLVGIAVRPPVDGDGDNIARGIKTGWCQHAAEFVA